MTNQLEELKAGLINVQFSALKFICRNPTDSRDDFIVFIQMYTEYFEKNISDHIGIAQSYNQEKLDELFGKLEEVIAVFDSTEDFISNKNLLYSSFANVLDLTKQVEESFIQGKRTVYFAFKFPKEGEEDEDYNDSSLFQFSGEDFLVMNSEMNYQCLIGKTMELFGKVLIPDQGMGIVREVLNEDLGTYRYYHVINGRKVQQIFPRPQSYTIKIRSMKDDFVQPTEFIYPIKDVEKTDKMVVKISFPDGKIVFREESVSFCMIELMKLYYYNQEQMSMKTADLGSRAVRFEDSKLIDAVDGSVIEFVNFMWFEFRKPE